MNGKDRIRKLAGWLLLPLLLCGCNQQDDVEEIFCSGTWYVVDYYTNVKWGANNDTSARPVNGNNLEELKVLQQFTLVFSDDGTLEGKIENGTYAGKWQADPDGRTVSITQLKASVGLSGRNKKYIEFLQHCSFYEGNSLNYLRLAPTETVTCIQFTHKD